MLSLIVQLFMNLSDVNYLRLKHKFDEHKFEKIEKLVEYHTKYLELVSALSIKLYLLCT